VPFELQPTLKGDAVEVRPLRADDFDALYAVASDPLIWEQHPSRDRYREDVFRAFFRDAMASGGVRCGVAEDGSVIFEVRAPGPVGLKPSAD
jgi:N-acetyltransferase